MVVARKIVWDRPAVRGFRQKHARDTVNKVARTTLALVKADASIPVVGSIGTSTTISEKTGNPRTSRWTRTGNLRESIKLRRNYVTAGGISTRRIVATAPYAKFYHEGFRYRGSLGKSWAGNPFFDRALAAALRVHRIKVLAVIKQPK